MAIHKRDVSGDHSISSMSAEDVETGKNIMSTATSVKGNPPKELRSAIRAENIVREESKHGVSMGAKDIVKIFTADKEYTEVTLEQVERVKKSTYFSPLFVTASLS